MLYQSTGDIFFVQQTIQVNLAIIFFKEPLESLTNGS